MSAKDNPYRFTLKFNEQDHRQKYVAELLNGMGRRKARYIADAILHYVNCTKNPAIEQDQDEILRQKIEVLVTQVLEKDLHQARMAGPETEEKPKLLLRKQVEVVSSEDSMPDVTNDQLQAILKSLDSLKK